MATFASGDVRVDGAAGPSRAQRARAWGLNLLILAIGPVALILIWWVAFAGELVDKNLLPSPFATLAETWRQALTGDLLLDFGQTLYRVGYAFGIAAVLGV
ncbi:MAG: hypothetical protein AAFR16_07905, partial [Pseudomonadota bacterium]